MGTLGEDLVFQLDRGEACRLRPSRWSDACASDHPIRRRRRGSGAIERRHGTSIPAWIISIGRDWPRWRISRYSAAPPPIERAKPCLLRELRARADRRPAERRPARNRQAAFSSVSTSPPPARADVRAAARECHRRGRPIGAAIDEAGLGLAKIPRTRPARSHAARRAPGRWSSRHHQGAFGDGAVVLSQVIGEPDDLAQRVADAADRAADLDAVDRHDHGQPGDLALLPVEHGRSEDEPAMRLIVREPRDRAPCRSSAIHSSMAAWALAIAAITSALLYGASRGTSTWAESGTRSPPPPRIAGGRPVARTRARRRTGNRTSARGPRPPEAPPSSRRSARRARRRPDPEWRSSQQCFWVSRGSASSPRPDLWAATRAATELAISVIVLQLPGLGGTWNACRARNPAMAAGRSGWSTGDITLMRRAGRPSPIARDAGRRISISRAMSPEITSRTGSPREAGPAQNGCDLREGNRAAPDCGVAMRIVAGIGKMNEARRGPSPASAAPISSLMKWALGKS